MKLAVLWVGKTRDRRLGALAAEYAERIERYCRLELRELRDAARDAAAEPRERAEREGRRLMKAIRPGEHLIALDERGDALGSEEFAAFLGAALEGHPAGVAMVIGGPYGLSEGLRRKSKRLISLSKMTFTHETARLIALEQIYRAFTILRGGRYHH
ncbi:MAG TPA: 23S rRNA (pseudouridine(1915)-N(3))-methyltransferase RlmH [Candidatus Saccharimonadales bacterium]|nr:23S rRNA (pseudouridine(1915)-N(3))-methyltransferase RlmH [Candidatus Saccharimonadales bacterium]